jgi:hypothetical protein
MRTFQIGCLVTVAFLITSVVWPHSSAQERLPDGTVVEFVTPLGTPISTAATAIVFTGPSDGTVDGPGNCATGGLLHSIVAIDPGGGVFSANVIVIRVDGVGNPAEVPPGTRLGPFVAIGTCGFNSEYQIYRAVVQ